MSADELEQKIAEISKQIEQLTEPVTVPQHIPLGPNLSRGSEELWNIYQYRLKEAQALRDLPDEVAFLTELSGLQSTAEINAAITKRLQDLSRTVEAPVLEPHIKHIPALTREERIEKAIAIGNKLRLDQHEDNSEQLAALNAELAQLEEQYMEAMM